jgi:YbbR domain-containing protein
MLERIVHNWPLKLVALGLAYAVWVNVAGDTAIVQDFEVPIDIVLAPDHVLAETSPNQVTVRLRGPETLLRNLDPLDLVMRLDMRDYSPPRLLDVQLSELHLSGVPRRVEVDFFDPPRLGIQLHRRLRRELPVEATLLGEVASGFKVYASRVRPEVVEVEGPESVVRELAAVTTDAISVGGRGRTFDSTVGVLPGRPLVRVVEPAPVEVRVIIDEAPVTRTIDGVAVTAPEIEPVSDISPATIAVTLSGPPALLGRLAPAALRARPLLEGLEGGGVQQAPVAISYPGLTADEAARLTVTETRPAEVTLRLPEPSVARAARAEE